MPPLRSSFSFVKMHGLGNDFVVLDNPPFPITPPKARAIADRHTGIGCDQLLVLTPTPHPVARRHLAIWNADGSAVEACGNGTRCIIGWLAEKDGLTPFYPMTLTSAAGLLKGWITQPGEAAVEQGTPAFLHQEPLDLSAWNLPQGYAVTLGNPHLVIFVDDVATLPVQKLGPLLEHHPAFAHKTNVEFVQVQETHLKVRVWERGAGETLACGTGACAAAFAVLTQQRIPGPTIRVILDGGPLTITWNPPLPLLQEGPFATVFEGNAFL